MKADASFICADLLDGNLFAHRFTCTLNAIQLPLHANLLSTSVDI